MANLEEYYDYIDQSKKEGDKTNLEELKNLVNAEKQGSPEESEQYEMVLKSIDRALELLNSKLEEATEIPGFQQEEINRLQAEGAKADSETFEGEVAGLDAEGISAQEHMTEEFEEVKEQVEQEYKGGDLQEPEALFNERMRKIGEKHEEKEESEKVLSPEEKEARWRALDRLIEGRFEYLQFYKKERSHTVDIIEKLKQGEASLQEFENLVVRNNHHPAFVEVVDQDKGKINEEIKDIIESLPIGYALPSHVETLTLGDAIKETISSEENKLDYINNLIKKKEEQIDEYSKEQKKLNI